MWHSKGLQYLKATRMLQLTWTSGNKIVEPFMCKSPGPGFGDINISITKALIIIPLTTTTFLPVKWTVARTVFGMVGGETRSDVHGKRGWCWKELEVLGTEIYSVLSFPEWASNRGRCLGILECAGESRLKPRILFGVGDGSFGGRYIPRFQISASCQQYNYTITNGQDLWGLVELQIECK